MNLFVAIKIIKLQIPFIYILQYFVCFFIVAPSSVGVIYFHRNDNEIFSQHSTRTDFRFNANHF